MSKRLFLGLCKSLGLFRIARHVTRNQLRILAYHGHALADEGLFRPQMFMDAQLFEARMEYLKRRGYPILELDEAVAQLQRDSLPPCATVITIDDGFFSTWKLAVPVLVQLQVPATIYLTTYYAVHETPVFRLAVRYMLWKTRQSSLSLSDLGVSNGPTMIIKDLTSRDQVTWQIVEYGEGSLGEEGRVSLCERLGRILGVDYEEIVRERLFTLMTLREVQAAVEQGVDIQLHTHRHRLPTEPDLVHREIDDNRRVLEPVVARPLHHFCYPSGVHDTAHLEPLTDIGIKSATTCEVGLNNSNTNPLVLHRFLDGNTISWIEFEAEMSGFSDLLRKTRSGIRTRLNRVRVPLGHRGAQLTAP